MPLPCSLDTCLYTTEEVAETLADMLELLKIHASACHPSTTPAATPTRQTQAERVKRPILNLSGQALEQEDYEHFLYMFDQYKNRLGGSRTGPRYCASAIEQMFPRSSTPTLEQT